MRIRRPCRHDCDLASLPVKLALLACAACRTVGNTVEEYLSDFILEMVEAPLILGLFFCLTLILKCTVLVRFTAPEGVSATNFRFTIQISLLLLTSSRLRRIEPVTRRSSKCLSATSSSYKQYTNKFLIASCRHQSSPILVNLLRSCLITSLSDMNCESAKSTAVWSLSLMAMSRVCLELKFENPLLCSQLQI